MKEKPIRVSGDPKGYDPFFVTDEDNKLICNRICELRNSTYCIDAPCLSYSRSENKAIYYVKKEAK